MTKHQRIEGKIARTFVAGPGERVRQALRRPRHCRGGFVPAVGLHDGLRLVRSRLPRRFRDAPPIALVSAPATHRRLPGGGALDARTIANLRAFVERYRASARARSSS